MISIIDLALEKFDSKTVELYNLIIQKINWRKNTDYYKSQVWLMQNYTYDQLKPVRNLCDFLNDKLEESMEVYGNENNDEDYIGFGQSDSTHDLIYQIIGEGMGCVQKYLEDPTELLKRLESEDYTESFSYCFPYEDDYEKLTLSFYQEQVKNIRAKIRANLPKLTTHQKELEAAEKILGEMDQGIFDSNYQLRELEEIGKKCKIGAVIANIWHDGSRFYQKAQIVI